MLLFSHVKRKGFTLLELLIALFILTLSSFMVTQVLHRVITIQAVTERHATRLRALQTALLLLSRDIEQSVNRPVLDATGQEQAAFIGQSVTLTLTHGGWANPGEMLARSTLQRVRYVLRDAALWRETWPVLDQAPNTLPQSRCLLTSIAQMRFQYLDEKNRFHDQWIRANDQPPLPRAVRVGLTFTNGEEMSQLYVIAALSD